LLVADYESAILRAAESSAGTRPFSLYGIAVSKSG